MLQVCARGCRCRATLRRLSWSCRPLRHAVIGQAVCRPSRSCPTIEARPPWRAGRWRELANLASIIIPDEAAAVMPEIEANRRPIASRSAAWAKASASFLARTSVTPNQISTSSVAFAAAGAALLELSPPYEPPYRLRARRPVAAGLQPDRRHGGDRGRQEILGRRALQ